MRAIQRMCRDLAEELNRQGPGGASASLIRDALDGLGLLLVEDPELDDRDGEEARGVSGGPLRPLPEILSSSRRRKGLSQTDVSDAVRKRGETLLANTLSRHERGAGPGPKRQVMRELVDILDLDPAEAHWAWALEQLGHDPISGGEAAP